MTALNHPLRSGHPLEQGHQALAGLPGLDAAGEQLEDLIAVLRAEQARRQAGIQGRRSAWKNLVFTGGPGAGRSRAAGSIARLYCELGLLSYGRLVEMAATDLIGTGLRETAQQVADVVRPSGDLLMITDVHLWRTLPDRGQHVLRCLYQQLTAAHTYHHCDELAVILSGQTGPLRDLLDSSPALAARFPAVIDFPGYTPDQLTGIFTTLAGEAGFTLTPAAQHKAATTLAAAEASHPSSNARLAVQLLNQATAHQARRLATTSGPHNPVALCTLDADDIPRHLPPYSSPPDDRQPGHYL